jgi:hypothetical protein
MQNAVYMKEIAALRTSIMRRNAHIFDWLVQQAGTAQVHLFHKKPALFHNNTTTPGKRCACTPLIFCLTVLTVANYIHILSGSHIFPVLYNISRSFYACFLWNLQFLTNLGCIPPVPISPITDSNSNFRSFRTCQPEE